MSVDVREALARLRAIDSDAATAAEAATDWLVGEEGALDDVSLMGLCEFLWYALPRKFLTTLDEHVSIARAVGRLFHEARMSHHADLCESPTTIQVLRAWDADSNAGFAAYQQALDATGVVPPDVPELSWGETMGFEESAVMDAVSLELERAIFDGRIRLGTPGWERRRRQITSQALARRDQSGGRTRREVVERERIRMWPILGGELRRRLAGAVASKIVEPVATPDGAEESVAGLRWLLEGAASNGLPLTEKHNLARSVVAEATKRFPAWTPRVVGSPRNEADVIELGEGRRLLQSAGALRRRARRLLITPSGRELLEDTGKLWSVATCALIQTGKGHSETAFGAACHEGELIVLSSGDSHSWADLRGAVLEMVVHQGWAHAAGGPVTADDVAWHMGDLHRRLIALNLYVRGEPRWRRSADQLSPLGVAAALHALRSRAMRPRE